MSELPIDTGGPAFAHGGSDHDLAQEGMTLLDWFAGQAMLGDVTRHGVQFFDSDATKAYDTAALMLAEKRRREGIGLRAERAP